ncbi:amino acid adenylation domain-containing protein [Wukongibacter sp. M2B1]|uniref:amino acid adenylation domain-containing protein n=1 Tax=Wukongibacter sp. M2B1 TaxID=3088895 RepID=UPI003D79174C
MVERRMSSGISESEKYWFDNLVDYKKISTLKYESIDDELNQGKAETLNIIFPDELSSRIMKICNSSEYGAYIILLTSISYIVYRYTGQEDILFGIPNLSKNAVTNGFSAILPLKLRIQQEIVFKELLQRMKKLITEIKYHHDISFAKLVEYMDMQGEEEKKLFKIIAVMENLSNFNKASSYQCEMMFRFNLRKDTIEGKIEYNSQIFSKGMIRQISKHLINFLTIVITQPDIEIFNIDILDKEEKDKILYDFNKNLTDYPSNKTIHQLFEEQVDRNPNNIAIVFGNKQLTYKELNERSNQIANYLLRRNIQKGSIISILMDRSINMIAGILGILKAGGVYLPIDPNYPIERIKYTIDDSKSHLVLTNEVHLTKLKDIEAIRVICLDDEIYDEYEISNTGVSVLSTDLAYIIYTSGTTGNPKGVMIQHKNVVNLILNKDIKFNFNERDVWTMFHSYCFDFSVWEIFGALMTGGKLIVVPKEISRSPKEFGGLLEREKVTILNQTPTAFVNMLRVDKTFSKDYSNLRYIIFGGEALKPRVLREFKERYPDIKLINMYGITETTVHVTYKELLKEDIDSKVSNIGKAIPGLRTYIMTKDQSLLPIGAIGELYVGGEGVSKGYLNRKELTKERFVQDPFIKKGKLYKTGDLARLLINGELEYLGRADNQVKIRGHRIELSEIESKIIGCEGVKEAKVIAKSDSDNNKYLCAYIVNETDMDISKIRSYLRLCLPDYMIPSYFTRLDQLPLTQNGKTDIKSLKELEDIAESGTKFEPPRNEIERKLVEIWKSILQADEVGIDDNFLELGGHSLKVITLASEICKEFSIDIPLTKMFKILTIGQLAEHIKIEQVNIYPKVQKVQEVQYFNELKNYYPTTSQQKRMYVLNNINKENLRYNVPLSYMIEGKLDIKRFENGFRELIKRHEILRTSFELIDNELVQRIDNAVNFEIEYLKVYEEESIRNFIRPFNLNEIPLFRCLLIRLKDDEHVFIIDMHHIIIDAVSISILFEEFSRIYEGRELPKSTVQYKDYAIWQANFKQGEEYNFQRQYWLNIFNNQIPSLNMPFDYPKSPMGELRDGEVLFNIGESLTSKLIRFSVDTNTTLFMVLLTAYNILLSKSTGQDDIVVGTPIAGRPYKNFEKLIGLFVNTIALRSYPSENKRVVDFLYEVKMSCLKAYENQDYQFDELVNELNIQRNVGENPIFQTMFILQNSRDVEFNIEGLKFISKKLNHKAAIFDILFEARLIGDTIGFTVDYDSRVFSKKTINSFVNKYLQILSIIVTNENVKLGEINI